MSPQTIRLATVLRQELALNQQEEDGPNLRCCCDACVEAVAADSHVRIIPDPKIIKNAFRELDESAFALPMFPLDMLTEEARAAVERFSQAKHRIHVLLHEIAAS